MQIKYISMGLKLIIVVPFFGLLSAVNNMTSTGAQDLPIWFKTEASVKAIQDELERTHGARIDARNDLGQTGLMFNITQERFGTFGTFGATKNVVELLIDYGADVNARSTQSPREEDHSFNNTPLHYIAILPNNRESVPIIDYLVDKGADINAQNSLGETPLMWTANLALMPDIRNVTRELLTDLADVNMQNNIGDTYLHILINNKDYIWVQELLDTYGSMFDLLIKNDQGWTPLDYAIQTMQPESERAIRTFKPVGFGDKVYDRDVLGRTGLMLAIIRGDFAFAQRHIQFRADVNAKDTTRFANTPLHLAALRRTSSEPFVKLLVDNGAQVNARNLYGDTPLHYLLVGNTSPVLNRPAIAKQLIAAGADPHVKNRMGYSVIDLVMKKNPAFAAQLESWYKEKQEADKK